ncbi:MAG: ABC transporter permease [Nitrospinaceae bacterium]|nr:ABC transporter permease [Nitrospinaceae bacterium]MBT3433491.1 ABC transporter permease [Nitrospinaceae bacterium]MBT3820604.1 ABC transporter permease [Nitrospinaceae bacterium]MBT4094200.1 ABC transporter permease [Nitrospinaceae bacterium]MBT4429498.1 ABC transporter permease [Nitrospinaceae bacterium]
MGAYLIRRAFRAMLVIVGVSFITFAVLFLSGDPTDTMVGEDWTREEVLKLRKDMGLDRPWIIQYTTYVSRAIQGDFGESLRYRQPAFELIAERVPATLELALVALLISVILALPLGILSASRRGSAYDYGGMLLALFGQAMPVFWLGLMLILIFGVHLHWLPVSGRGGFERLILPAITLATYSLARNTRVIRSSMLEVLGLDYVRTARAKGLAERSIVYIHALRNSLIPVVTIIGLEFGHLLGGAVIVETIFAWPGIGRLMIQAVYAKDFPLVQASVTIAAVIFVSINFLVDFIYSYLDPRVRLV